MYDIKLLLETKGEDIQFFTKLILSFLFALVLSYKAIPFIIRISKNKNLMDIPGERSSHEYKIPNLGGDSSVLCNRDLYSYLCI